MLSREYRELLKQIKKNNKSDIDTYGATNPAEFFAVVTEYFFEKPVELKKLHPELYDQFKNFYKLDTAAMILLSENKNKNV